MTSEENQIVSKFYAEHFDALVTHAYRFIKDWHLANDIVQDSFGTLDDSDKLNDFLASENRIGWLKNVVKNKARNLARTRGRELKRLISYEELYEEPSTTDHYPSEDRDVTGKIRKRLTREELYYLKRLILDEVSYSEMAEELGLSIWACYKRMEAIRKQLQDELKSDD